ncbi:hypothetical protein [Caldimonas sp. KR1-144]|uniref:hypothetical protein n=1 Tax=Caldimonas sp. KR1-144 TaxID=3400911 RepID=UPI003C0CF217
MKRAGSHEPYTEDAIRRLKCVRCGARAKFQWQCCADGNTWRPICPACDVELNALVLLWMRDPEAEAKVSDYAQQKGVLL